MASWFLNIVAELELGSRATLGGTRLDFHGHPHIEGYWVEHTLLGNPVAMSRSKKAPDKRYYLAFDGWTSRNRHPLFGVVAFFLDPDSKPQKIVLGLPNLTDRHPDRHECSSVCDMGADVSNSLVYIVA